MSKKEDKGKVIKNQYDLFDNPMINAARKALSEEDKKIVGRAKKIQKFLTQPLFVAASFTNIPGKFVPREKSVEDFKKIVSGECDEMPEQAFYMVGTLEEALEKAKSYHE